MKGWSHFQLAHPAPIKKYDPNPPGPQNGLDYLSLAHKQATEAALKKVVKPTQNWATPYDERAAAIQEANLRSLQPAPVNTRMTAAAAMYAAANRDRFGNPIAPTAEEIAAQRAYEQNSLNAMLKGRGNPYAPSAQYPNGYYGYTPAGYGLTPQYPTSPTHSLLTDFLGMTPYKNSKESGPGKNRDKNAVGGALPSVGKNDTQDILPYFPGELPPDQPAPYNPYPSGGGYNIQNLNSQPYSWMAKLMNWRVNF
jgi:hypothetical protein